MFDKDDIFNYAYMAKKDRKMYKKLIAETNKLIAESNKRLREIESADLSTPATKYIEHQIKQMRGNRAKRFARVSLKTEPSIREVRNIATYALGFIESKTSTVAGYEESNKQRLETISNRYGLDMESTDSFSEYMKSETFKILVNWDSATAMQFGLDHIEDMDDIGTLNDIYNDWKAKKLATADLFSDKVWKRYEGNNNKR